METDDAPENKPQFTTVYVGNLAPEVTQLDLCRLFHILGAGSIEEVRIQHDKGFGFVRCSTHSEAAMPIQLGNTRVLCGKAIKANAFRFNHGLENVCHIGVGADVYLQQEMIRDARGWRKLSLFEEQENQRVLQLRLCSTRF